VPSSIQATTGRPTMCGANSGLTPFGCLHPLTLVDDKPSLSPPSYFSYDWVLLNLDPANMPANPNPDYPITN